uniref:Uncharacterized protein n=1 Tax=Haptolina ericina TaxID=156174 RepID=A0A7S3AGW8_9EUKA|mmetsp:Transcript_17957/g.40180  ORF Transcript_17957/g.40180 Transcript_17957/m.40180 type:complete len:161 (+) Transcript_17957:82-564(+)|eukprot:CAMPEP_0181217916 /NCGR_PEP_ID=MMETSP1096-20121128/27408_1 /TAXON_ID=156174 ORGANISM="Chrysochromulina ericina, Strain CCMP281" /NCGR_SAMPLE_ID=MMETSP1096 /ASSEMBLY_ACC=CAM_ASM_000453 /LENGTH=160 /DNA_ID=CAMNT_0023310083 /DNA_START=65 /DNA_END=547 /DNA_ORIENTATION=-
MLGAGSSNSAAFEEHAAWIRALREDYPSLHNQLSSSRTNAETHMTRRNNIQPPTTPSRPSLLGGGGLHAHDPGVDQAIDDDDFEEPVYRGLSLAAFASDSSDAQEVGHAPSAYRGLSAIDNAAFDSTRGVDTSLRPSLIPPLVQRQRAGTLDVGAGFGFP